MQIVGKGAQGAPHIFKPVAKLPNPPAHTKKAARSLLARVARELLCVTIYGT